MTGAPRVVKGKVLIGNGGAEYGVRGYVSAFVFVGAVMLIAIVSFAVSYGAAAAQPLLRSLGLGTADRNVIGVLGPLVGIGVGYVFFLLIYRTVPRTRVPVMSRWLSQFGW